MSAISKPDLCRAGTMEVTAKEGTNFLDRNLTEWKKPFLINPDTGADTSSNDSSTPSKLSKHTTMIGTAKEAKAFLDVSGAPDVDAHTRRQQKQIEQISAEPPSPAKKPRVTKANTMVATAKEGNELLKNEKLTKSRKSSGKPSVKRKSTISVAIAEAQGIYGSLDKSEGRTLRKRAKVATPALKKAGTMQATAKEGKAFLKRSKKKSQ